MSSLRLPGPECPTYAAGGGRRGNGSDDAGRLGGSPAAHSPRIKRRCSASLKCRGSVSTRGSRSSRKSGRLPAAPSGQRGGQDQREQRFNWSIGVWFPASGKPRRSGPSRIACVGSSGRSCTNASATSHECECFRPWTRGHRAWVHRLSWEHEAERHVVDEISTLPQIQIPSKTNYWIPKEHVQSVMSTSPIERPRRRRASSERRHATSTGAPLTKSTPDSTQRRETPERLP